MRVRQLNSKISITKIKSRLILALLTVLQFCVTVTYSQSEVEMADTLRSEGKIYVIVAIILIILAGLLVYLFLLDKKVARIEKQLGNKP